MTLLMMLKISSTRLLRHCTSRRFRSFGARRSTALDKTQLIAKKSDMFLIKKFKILISLLRTYYLIIHFKYKTIQSIASVRNRFTSNTCLVSSMLNLLLNMTSLTLSILFLIAFLRSCYHHPRNFCLSRIIRESLKISLIHSIVYLL